MSDDAGGSTSGSASASRRVYHTELSSVPPPSAWTSVSLGLSGSLAMVGYSGFDDGDDDDFEMPGGDDFMDVTELFVAGGRGM